MKRRILPMIMVITIIMSVIQVPAWAATGDDPAGEDGNPGQVSEQPVEESTEPSAPVEEEKLASSVTNSLSDGETEEEATPKEPADNVAEVNGKGYPTLQEAITAAKGAEITLLADVKGQERVNIDDGETVTIDLNNYDVTFAANEQNVYNSFYVTHGTLNLLGTGRVSEQEGGEFYAPVLVEGATNDQKDYSVVNVGEGVTLQGWAGIMIDHNSAMTAYGVVVNVDGTLCSVRDASDSGGHALYINGSIAATEGNVPKITLDGATLNTEAGNGMYLAGYAETSIRNSTITSSSEGSTGIEIRAGKLTITGSTVTGGSGEYEGGPNGNGSTSSNVALAVVQHTTKLPLEVTVNGGTFSGGAAFIQADEQNNGDEAIAKIKIDIQDGKFEGEVYSKNIAKFISGGTFSSNVSEYLADNTALTPNADGTFKVTEESGDSVVAVTNIGGTETKHTSLAAAIAKINSAGPASEVTLTLQQSQILTDTITFNKNLNITVDLNGEVLRGPSNGYVFQFGSFTATGGGAAYQDYTNTGTLTIKNGTVIGYRGVMNYFGNVVLDKGLSMEANERIVNMRGGKVTVQGAELTSEAGYGILLFNSFYAFDSAPQNPEYANDNHERNKGAELVMISGSIDVALSAVSGNNLASAGSKATISGGTLNVNESGTAIYWPMEGELTITGGSITGGTAIEAKMGTIIISGDAQITGTGKYTESEPENGGSSPEGSALLLSSQMYGNYEGQCRESNELTVKITGGTLTSQNGNAVTVYNTEQQTGDDAQTTDVAITGGKLSGELGAIVSVVASDKNEVTTGENQQTASKSQTTLKVSGDVAPASINTDGKTTYYTTVSGAVEDIEGSEDETQISVFGNTTISTDVELKDNITLVVAPGVTLSADVTSGETGKVITVTTDEDDNTIYKLAEKPDGPTTAYTASITDAEGNVLSYFDTLANAVKTVQDGQIITLLKTTSEGTITVSRPVSFTINPGTTTGNSYTIAAGSGYVLSVSGNTYTITAYVPPTPVDPGDDDDDDNNNSGSTSVRRYNIEADAGRGGDISPDGRVRVRRGENQTFRITAADGWEIADVEVDGESVGAVERYTFENVRTDHTISATFRQIVTEPEAPTLPFTDVAEGDWYYDAVAYCWENGIMDGTSGTVFAPNLLLNRAMMAQVLYNLADGTASTAAGFPDVAASAWYADAVNWAAANGYVTGYDNGSYGPEDSLTREQLAVILYRYAGSPAPAGTLDGFADAASASDYAVDALRWAVGEGLLTGKDGGRLDPTGTASRAELAQILARFAQM